ncbi:unnamed protein product [Darwinula stevensoni]|uniref:Protein FAM177A1 n=1 Tax=Darwinula stevensoni TaxID=69355 RepID=A0A7R9A4J5_9CRUS|nr:unnamed protein product [Darwinula stevensoni]CAG0883504.1 unnamed protein product [Darwinula stevensoni]
MEGETGENESSSTTEQKIQVHAEDNEAIDAKEVKMDIKPDEEKTSKKKKKPKRVLHFRDGTMEEFSSSDEEKEEGQSQASQKQLADLKKLSWMPWAWEVTLLAGYKALAVCDYLGETFASFLGITMPKYQFEIDEYNRLQEEAKEHELTNAGWESGKQNKFILDSMEGGKERVEVHPDSTKWQRF